MHLLPLYPTSTKQQLGAIYRRLIDALLFAMRSTLDRNTVQITIEKEKDSWRDSVTTPIHSHHSLSLLFAEEIATDNERWMGDGR
jgi:predicted component of type VI protein secretion system